MLFDKKKRTQFFVYRKRGEKPAQFYLILLVNSRTYPNAPKKHYGLWHLPFKYKGELAVTAPRWQDCYEVSQRKLPEDIDKQVRICINNILEKGTPLENDESIFDY